MVHNIISLLTQVNECIESNWKGRVKPFTMQELKDNFGWLTIELLTRDLILMRDETIPAVKKNKRRK